jgi:hypothetical protein
MASRKLGNVPADLRRAGQRFAGWRQRRTAGSRIPEPLWTLATELATVHGLHRTALVLGLDYYSLKQRVESSCRSGDHSGDRPGDQRTPAAFVELSPPSLPLSSPSPIASPSSRECLLEFENGLGAKMRVHLKGHDAPDLASLCRSFWNRDSWTAE